MTSAADLHLRERAESILRRQGVVDGHNDLPWAARVAADYDLEALDLQDTAQVTHTDLRRLRAGRVGGQFWSVYVPAHLDADGAVVATLEQIDFVHQMVDAHPEDLVLVVDAAGIDAAQVSGRIACLIGAEGGHSIGGSLGALRSLQRLGVRYLTLTHNQNLPWADSATDVPAVGGLTSFGREVVRELNRLGMLVDLSHVATTTMHAALDVSEAPVIFSHSSCRALVDHPRNVPDDVLERLRGNEGICMVSFVPDFISEECRDWTVRRERHALAGLAEGHLDPVGLARDFERGDPRPRATLAQVADHVEHARDVLGVTGVGIGGDYDGTDDFPDDLPDVSGYPALFTELLRRGWSDEDCELVAGRNVVRVLERAEQVAADLAARRRPSRARIGLAD